MTEDVPPRLAGHPDRIRWNAKYAGGAGAAFAPHPLAARALALLPPDGPVLDLACGPSGAALLAAGQGRPVTAVDVSDTALGLLDAEARRRGVRGLLTLVHADLGEWAAGGPGGFALVLCTGFWDRLVFGPAAGTVAPGGLLAWEAFTTGARTVRPGLPAEWCLAPGEPAALLPAGFTVLAEEDVPDDRHGTKRRLLARRGGPDRA
ncbi:class I SAM-dependent methyltransferase [Spirillospora sp. NPDC029432]|uniref:class I SAM-dependent methyltransferase n=1 Tax=Spirillospora sp. NPDC029432 TaxID=3154599 RepID=UPI0034532DFB